MGTLLMLIMIFPEKYDRLRKKYLKVIAGYS